MLGLSPLVARYSSFLLLLLYFVNFFVIGGCECYCGSKQRERRSLMCLTSYGTHLSYPLAPLSLPLPLPFFSPLPLPPLSPPLSLPSPSPLPPLSLPSPSPLPPLSLPSPPLSNFYFLFFYCFTGKRTINSHLVPSLRLPPIPSLPLLNPPCPSLTPPNPSLPLLIPSLSRPYLTPPYPSLPLLTPPYPSLSLFHPSLPPLVSPSRQWK